MRRVGATRYLPGADRSTCPRHTAKGPPLRGRAGGGAPASLDEIESTVGLPGRRSERREAARLGPRALDISLERRDFGWKRGSDEEILSCAGLGDPRERA